MRCPSSEPPTTPSPSTALRWTACAAFWMPMPRPANCPRSSTKSNPAPWTSRVCRSAAQMVAIRAADLQTLDVQGAGVLFVDDLGQFAGLGIGIQKAAQAVQRSAVLGEGVVGGSEEGQRILHLPKGLRGLHHITELDGTAEKARRLQQKGKDHGHLVDGEVEAVELQAAVDQGPDIGDQCREARQKRVAFDGRALVEIGRAHV